MKDRYYLLLVLFSVAAFCSVVKDSNSATSNNALLPAMEEEQLPIIVQHNGHKLLRVDDYEVGKHCYFWHDQVGSMFCTDMAASHDAERE